MSTRTEAGRKAKLDGHRFEKNLANSLSESKGLPFEVHGSSKTKIDIQSVDGLVRLSVKNASGRNTQIGLISQKNFALAMGDLPNEAMTFVNKFFGDDALNKYPRHRMTFSQIDDVERSSFLNYLNTNKDKIYKLLFTDGFNQNGNVNYLAWAKIKDDPSSVVLVNLADFRETFLKGVWAASETTFHFMVDGVKVLHLQMKGSGAKYSAGYHSLQFHVYDHLFN